MVDQLLLRVLQLDQGQDQSNPRDSFPLVEEVNVALNRVHNLIVTRWRHSMFHYSSRITRNEKRTISKRWENDRTLFVEEVFSSFLIQKEEVCIEIENSFAN